MLGDGVKGIQRVISIIVACHIHINPSHNYHCRTTKKPSSNRETLHTASPTGATAVATGASRCRGWRGRRKTYWRKRSHRTRTGPPRILPNVSRMRNRHWGRKRLHSLRLEEAVAEGKLRCADLNQEEKEAEADGTNRIPLKLTKLFPRNRQIWVDSWNTWQLFILGNLFELDAFEGESNH